MPQNLSRARMALFAVTALACCGLLLPFSTRIVLDPKPFFGLLPSLALIFGLAVYLNRRGMVVLRGLMEVLGCAVVISYAAIVWSYAAISFAFPLADQTLIALDARLGFDWLAFATLVDRMPLLEDALFAAYQSFLYQLVLIPLLLAVTGLAARGYMLVAGFGLLCLAASIVSVWFPALGAHVALGVDPQTLKNLNPHFGYAFLDQFHAVRSEPRFLLSVDRAEGILTFPSVHAGAAFLCAWAAWGSPLLRFPLAVLNIAMAVSAISHGSHYLIDVLAGIALAAGIVFALDLFVRRRFFLRSTDYASAGIR